MYQEDKTKEEKHDLASLLVLFTYAKGHAKYLFLSVCLVVVSSAMLMVSASFLGQLVEAVRAQSSSDVITKLLITVIACEILFVAIRYQAAYGIYFVTNKIVLKVRKHLFRKITVLPAKYFDAQPLGRNITRLTTDVEGIENFFSGALSRFVSASVNIVAVFVAMILTDAYLGSLVVLASFPALAFVLLSRAPVRHWLREYKKRNAMINARLAEFISGMTVIRVFGLESWSYRQFNQLTEHLRSAGLKITNWNSAIRPFAAFLCAFPLITTLWFGGHLVIQQTATVGLIVAFVRYCERFYWPIMMVTNEIHVIQEAFVCSERIRQMLSEPEEQDVLGADGRYTNTIQGNLSFQNVSMEYAKGKAILKNIDFEVQAGQSIGLVGKTGSGKTTTVNLLPSLYPVSQGQILLDDVPLTQWSRACVRQQIGIVSQEVAIFKDTIRFNLVAVCPDRARIDDKAIQEACEQTGFNAVIERLPQGLDTVMVESGENLSMGERQLLAITRMLLRNPRILLLDEATANIDPKTEDLIKKAVRKIMHGRTCFVIAHRLNTVEDCDKILVFDQGQIIEQGSHSDLVGRQGYYADLYSKQAGSAALMY